jgi:hypothetical protein
MGRKARTDSIFSANSLVEDDVVDLIKKMVLGVDFDKTKWYAIFIL